MITKNYKSIFSFVAALTIGFFMVSCDQEDDTGYSTMVPTSPSLGITVSETNVILVENDQVFEFTASLSEVQLVDVKLYAFQAGGDADGDDFELTGSLVIPAGATSATGTLKILKDDVIEETETLKIQIGDNKTANASKDSGFIDVTILNYEDGDLIIDLAWSLTEPAYEDDGTELDPTEMGDLVLSLSSTPDLENIIGQADGGSFETLVMPSSTPDGVYYVIASFWDANSDITRGFNLLLDLNQPGVITADGYEYPAALDSGNSCSTVYFITGTITKSGESYTYESTGEIKTPVVLEDFVGVYEGETPYGPTNIVTTLNANGQLEETGMSVEWMTGFWGEVITDQTTLLMDVDMATGNFTIAQAYYMQTTYDGAVQPPYDLVATGNLNACALSMSINVNLIQDGWDVGAYLADNGYDSLLENVTIK